MITDAAEIRSNYLCSWFVIDFVSVVPFDHIAGLLMGGGAENEMRSLRMVRMARMMRFARLARLAKLTNVRAATAFQPLQVCLSRATLCATTLIMNLDCAQQLRKLTAHLNIFIRLVGIAVGETVMWLTLPLHPH